VLRLPRSGLSPQHLAGRVGSVRFGLDGEPAAGKRCDGWPWPMVTHGDGNAPGVGAATATWEGRAAVGTARRDVAGDTGCGLGWAVACLWRTCGRFCPHLRHHGVGKYPPHHRRVRVGLSAAVAGGQLTITVHANDLPFGLPTLVSYTACRTGAALRHRKPK
jgi:hypothetical protein